MLPVLRCAAYLLCLPEGQVAQVFFRLSIGIHPIKLERYRED